MKAVLAAAAMVCMVACTVPGSAKATPSGSPSGTPLSPASGKLDAEVAMPAGFPSDVPIYPGARLTAAASFSGQGEVTWGMEWESLDDPPKVAQFYAAKLDQGDWMINSTTRPNGNFTVTFSRKSNSHFTGTLGIDGTSGVAKVSMSLISPTS